MSDADSDGDLFRVAGSHGDRFRGAGSDGDRLKGVSRVLDQQQNKLPLELLWYQEYPAGTFHSRRQYCIVNPVTRTEKQYGTVNFVTRTEKIIWHSESCNTNRKKTNNMA